MRIPTLPFQTSNCSGGRRRDLAAVPRGLDFKHRAIRRLVGLAAAIVAIPIFAQSTNQPLRIDLPTTLRLAGAQNLDVKIAREQSAEAKANYRAALARFFPWITPGITYHRRDGMAQAVPAGTISKTDYNSYAPGTTVGVQVDLGEAIYQSLSAKQRAAAADHAFEAQRQETVHAAAKAYFELALAEGAVGVANDATRISSGYEAQLVSAVDAGVAFKGDLLRARVQAERNRLTMRKAIETQRTAAARLAQVLRVDPSIELLTEDSALAPLTLVATNTALDSLVAQAFASRPELKQDAALVSAARENKNGAVFGPLIPTLGAQGFFGGLGGGHDGSPDRFGQERDFLVGATWRIGPGGLFDFTRKRAAESRLNRAELTLEKQRDEITRQTVEAFAHLESIRDQLALAERAVAAAQEGFRLTQQRKGFAVGVVLETIQAEEDLTRARLDFLKAIAEFNTAQYSLAKALGKL